MKILITTLGSRGDTQPYLALAVGMQQAGHQVTITAPKIFTDWILSYGVGVHPVRFNPQEVIKSLSKSMNPFQAMLRMRDIMNKGIQDALEDCWIAAQDTDFLIQTGTGNNALEVAAKRGIPVAFAYLIPMAPNHDFPNFMFPYRFSFGRAYNYFTYIFMKRLLWTTIGGPVVNRWRQKIGLPTWRSEAELERYKLKVQVPSLYGYSNSVLSHSTWKDEHITGYWFLAAHPDWQPPDRLLEFLESGPLPVYVGFGSMNQENPERQVQLAIDTLEITKQRGVISTGLLYPMERFIHKDIYFINDIPHDWLFPRMSAVVHHGGAGTTAASLRAGVPSIITPFSGDQFAWADTTVRLGVGQKVSGGRNVTPQNLAAAVQNSLNNSMMRTRANELGKKIRAEKGIENAVALIERYSKDYYGDISD